MWKYDTGRAIIRKEGAATLGCNNIARHCF
jgi:hypothetical protein